MTFPSLSMTVRTSPNPQLDADFFLARGRVGVNALPSGLPHLKSHRPPPAIGIVLQYLGAMAYAGTPIMKLLRDAESDMTYRADLT